MDETSMYMSFQGAIDRSKGAASWSDVLLAISRARESKVKEQLDSIISGLNLDALSRAQELAWAEIRKAQDAQAPKPTPPQQQPVQPKPKARKG